jgi:hypothetical protein
MVKKLRKTWENPWDLYGIYGFHHKKPCDFPEENRDFTSTKINMELNKL